MRVSDRTLHHIEHVVAVLLVVPVAHDQQVPVQLVEGFEEGLLFALVQHAAHHAVLRVELENVALAGPSGVGKSTLLNEIFGRELTRTGKISDAHDKGMHTTTFSEMYFLPQGAIIDTPGIKGFGSIDMQREEVSHYFRDIFRVGRDCRFSNCTHTNEPGCAVQDALITGDVSISRYESYLSLLEDTKAEKYRA